MQQVRTRFAPSPTGYLHLGGLRTALYTWLLARKYNGRFILRIEDTDQEREVPGSVELIYKSMRQAGLTYDEGPDVGGDYGPYIQSQRKDTYLPYALQLIESGHAYPCFCTKEELDKRRAETTQRGDTWKYDKKCLSIPKEEAKRRMESGESYVIRQNIPATGTAGFDDILYGHVEVSCDTLDDNVLIKADGLPTYNFANVIDDHLMAISHVTRGTEYLSSAPKYNLLYSALGWTPPLYIHLPVVMKDATRKLSKRHGDPSFEDLLEMGYLREAIINFIALLGWSPGTDQEFFTLEELIEAFDETTLNKSPAIFNMDKLTWFNTEYIRRLPFEEYLELATPWFDKTLQGVEIDYKRLAELMQSRTEVFNRIPDMVAFLKEVPEYEVGLYINKRSKTTVENSKEALEFILPVIEGIEPWSEPVIHDALMGAIADSGRKNGAVLWPLRIALSGQQSTPGGAVEIACLLGKEESILRIQKALKKLAAEV
ncbi:MAG TPA: glutamate--tRNA ligase [Clostridiales bacterium]|jgi:glutamyl-tRNA synthetase|nr:glutamate--tRNA ligase [Clostridiales bacterium]